MDTRFLTPVQLWKDFEPALDKYDESYITYNKTEGVVRTSFFFTAINDEKGYVRPYVEMIQPEKAKKCLICIKNFGKEGLMFSKMEPLLASSPDSIFITLDIGNKGECHTIYSGEYANEANNFENNFYNATPSAENNPYFLLTKICRRFLSFLNSNITKIRPIILADGILTPILWMLGGTDDRLNGIMSRLGTPFNSTIFHPQTIDNNFDRWDIGISPLAYAHFLKCPALVVTSSNSPYAQHEGAKQIFNALPEGKRCDILLSPLLSEQVYSETTTNIIKWINNIYSPAETPAITPTLSYAMEGAMVKLHLNLPENSRKVANVDFWYNYNESNPRYRSWNLEKQKATRDEDVEEYETTIKLYPDCDFINVYATVSYRNGADASTPILKIDLTDYPERSRIVKSQLVYDTTMGSKFYPITDKWTVGENVVSIKKCPLGISGITTSQGILASHVIGEYEKFNVGEALQFNAFSDSARQITVSLVQQNEEGEYITYSAPVWLQGQDTWQKISLKTGDLRNSELKPLTNWNNLKEIRFLDSENVLFNNMLWV